MIIQQLQTDASVIDGTWGFTETFTPSAEGANYDYDFGVFSDVTGASTGKIWSFAPASNFLGREFTVSEEYNLSGILLNRVTSDGASRIHKLDNSSGGGLIRQKFHGYAVGSYGEFVAEIVLPMMAAEGAEIGLFNDAATQWNRNCWGFGFDLTGIISRSSYWGGWTKLRGGFLISPRHIVFASHYPLFPGDQVQFVKKGATAELDQVVTKTVQATTPFPYNPNSYDNHIGLLDSDVPAGISPIPCCDFSSRAPGIMCGKYSDLVLKTSSSKYIQGLGVDGGLFQFVIPDGSGYGSTYTTTGLAEYIADSIPYFAAFSAFIRPLLRGDSGSPHLQILSETTVGFRVISTTAQASDCNAAIVIVDTLGGVATGHTVTVAADPTL